MHSRRLASIPRNRLARPLAVWSTITLMAVGLSMLIDVPWLTTLAIFWLPLGCLLLVIGYTLIALRIGWIATVGHVGQIHHYQRSRQPIAYWLLSVLYLVVCVPALVYWLFRVLPNA